MNSTLCVRIGCSVSMSFAALLTAGIALADTIISDEVFPLAGWTASTYIATNFADQVAVESETGGNPDNCRFMTHYMTPFSQLGVLHTFGYGYIPAVHGHIDWVDYDEDRMVWTPAAAAVGSTPALVQDGIAYYGTTDMTFSGATWQHGSATHLTEVSFTSATGTHPNFSNTGTAINFGYTRSNSNSGANTYQVGHGIDNWKYTLHPGGTTGVGDGDHTARRSFHLVGPNPFADRVTIRIDRAGMSLGVYDQSGRLVRRLVDPGLALVTWDGRDSKGRRVSPGVYFLRESDAPGPSSVKVVLTR